MNTAANMGLRRGEVIAALSQATDLAMGQPVEFALKSCVLATRLGRALRLDPADLAAVFYQSLLRYVGCNAETHAMTALLGDEIDFRRDYALIDTGHASEVASLVFAHLRRANSGLGTIGLIAGVARGMLNGPRIAAENIAAHCEVAERLAERLSLSPDVCRNLAYVYERWDGRGLPHGVAGENVPLAVRVVSLAQDAIVLTAACGAGTAKEKLEARSGSAYEPRLVDVFLARADELTSGLDETTWDSVLALEPEPQRQLTDEEFDAACLAIADFADLKSPFSGGHSRAVSALAVAAARRCGLPEADVVDLARAALVHDIGQVGVPARVWLKPGPFNDGEWEQARLHTYYGERVLARPAALARLGAIVAQHHERCDGSGYHRGAAGRFLTPQGKILAAAEAYQNKIEPRPHRAALSPQAAADALKREARQGALDGDAVAAVLAAAGHATPARKELVAGLTAREIEVLRQIARGQPTKEIGRALGVSPKTVDNHTQSIFAKIDVKTRGGATLFAIERGLCGS